MAEPSSPSSIPGHAGDLPDDVTTPLLILITRRSLDADYEHVAARNRATGRVGDPTGHPLQRRTAAVVLLVFGALVTVAAVQTSRNAPAEDANRASLIDQVNARRASVASLQEELAREQKRGLVLQKRLTSLSTSQNAARDEVQRLEARTGYGVVRGPGIKVSLSGPPGATSTEMVRDSDLALLTDALWAAGAEAITVNNRRITVLSAFRNVGIGILLGGQPINPPYDFEVIGDPDSLPANLLSTRAGAAWYSLKDSLGFRFEVRNGGTMTLPAAQLQPLRSARIAGDRDRPGPTGNRDTDSQKGSAS